MNGSLWQSHKNLAGMAREKAMEQAVEEAARQKKCFPMRLLCQDLQVEVPVNCPDQSERKTTASLPCRHKQAVSKM